MNFANRKSKILVVAIVLLLGGASILTLVNIDEARAASPSSSMVHTGNLNLPGAPGLAASVMRFEDKQYNVVCYVGETGMMSCLKK